MHKQKNIENIISPLKKNHVMLGLWLVFALFICSSSTFGQVTVNVQNQTIKQTLRNIEHSTAYKFFYSDQLTDLNKVVSLNVKNQTIEVTLSKLFSGTQLSYTKKENNQFVIFTKSVASIPSQQEYSGRKISGIVKDEKGEPIIGANVVEKGTTNGTITDIDGKFRLTLTKNNSQLQFSYIGYMDKLISVGESSTLAINLKEDTQKLDEVVVVGYGVQKKVSMTSAVSQLKNEELSIRPTSNMQQALQGLSAGLSVTDAGGAPGRSAATVRVRGITTLTTTKDGMTVGSNDPLVLVDGIEQRFDDINANDIESISILKDAASSSIYGSRAANGVILVTTKRAKTGEIKIQYNGTYSLMSATNTPKHMGLEDYLRYQNIAYQNAGMAVKYSEDYIKEYVNATDRLKYPYPNVYMDEMFKTAPMLDNTVTLSGGSDSFKGLVSLRYKDEDGILTSNINKVSGMRVNTDLKKGIFVFNIDMDYRYNYSTTSLYNVINYIYHGSQWAVPKYPDGTYGLSKQGNNPMILNDIAGNSKLKKNYYVGNMKMIINLTKDLNISTQYSVDITNNIQKDFANSYQVKNYWTKQIIKNVDKNSLTEARTNIKEETFTSLINYSKNFGLHEIKALAGYSQINNKTNYLSGYKEYFYNNDVTSISMGGEDNRKVSGYDHKWGLKSYFGRLNYNYNDRYLLEGNIRWDGSSRFVGSGTYAFFPSASAAWRVSEEKFWNKNQNFFNDLKLRASWGKTGNQAIPLYEFYPALNSTDYTFNDQIAVGYIQSNMSNKDLTWETTTQTDLGIDAFLLNSRLSIIADYYNKITNDILLTLPIPGVIGLVAPLQNAGKVRNRGLELQMTWRDKFKDFSYDITANIASNSNKILDLAGSGPYKTTSSTDPMTIKAEGLPIDSHWGYKTDGLFQTQEEVNSYPTLFKNTKPGDVKYVDLNEDGKITPEDMTYLGNTFPKYTYGLNGSFTYKNFSFYMQWQGAADVDVRISGALIEMGNQEGFTHDIYVNNVWTPEHTDARFPRPIKFDLRNVQSSDRVLIDGSYLRLKTVQLSYFIPDNLVHKLFLQKAKVFVSASNILTFSKLNEWGLDAEFPSGRANYYPQRSIYSLGVNLEF